MRNIFDYYSREAVSIPPGRPEVVITDGGKINIFRARTAKSKKGLYLKIYINDEAYSIYLKEVTK